VETDSEAWSERLDCTSCGEVIAHPTTSFSYIEIFTTVRTFRKHVVASLCISSVVSFGEGGCTTDVLIFTCCSAATSACYVSWRLVISCAQRASGKSNETLREYFLASLLNFRSNFTDASIVETVDTSLFEEKLTNWLLSVCISLNEVWDIMSFLSPTIWKKTSHTCRLSLILLGQLASSKWLWSCCWCFYGWRGRIIYGTNWRDIIQFWRAVWLIPQEIISESDHPIVLLNFCETLLGLWSRWQ